MASLPSGYQEVEYLKSSGTQYINTGYKANSENYRITCGFSVTTLSANAVLFGGGASTDIISAMMTSDSNLKFYVGSGSVSGALSPFSAGVDYEMECVANNGTLAVTLNGARRSGAYSGSINKDYPLFIFANNSSGSAGQYSSLKVYRFQIYDNGILVRDFVPCYRKSDNVAGLYDTAQGAFYTNAGTGSFSPGPNVTPSEPAGPVPEIVLPFPFALRRRRLMMAGGGFLIYNGAKYKRGQSVTITASTSVQIVGKLNIALHVVGAGGGGGAGAYPNYGSTGGGGGSGGLSEDTQRVSAGVYSIVVGSGGTPGTFTKGSQWGDSQTAATNGGSSSAFGVTAGGGVRGGNAGVATGTGGTGGTGGSGATRNGNAGANGKSYSTTVGAGGASVYGGYGAGGAGGRGTSSGSATAKAGGAGVVVITII